MSKIVIDGGRRLSGSIRIHGAKNAVLPILAAAVLNGGENTIYNCPRLRDVYSSVDILRYLGCSAQWEGSTIRIHSGGVSSHYIPEELMREMRSSIIFLGAVLARNRHAILAYPGGCELGPRPIDLHLKAFRQLGVDIVDEHGYIKCSLDHLRCGNVHLEFPSVGATENVMLLATVSDGITTISNAAKEPEIVDLQEYLNGMGAKVSGAGSGMITVEGVSSFHDVSHRIIPDRIVAATYMCACAITGGKVTLTDVEPAHIQPVIAVLRECGCSIVDGTDYISIESELPTRAIDYIRTMPHPGFPTDAQPPLMPVLALSKGTSIVAERMFENRFNFVPCLNRMGADIKVDGTLAVVKGVERLSGACVTATDLRGAAALVVAGLAARGTTEVSGLEHLDRGYENLEEGLFSLGADIKRVE